MAIIATNELKGETFGELRELIKNTVALPKLDIEYFMEYIILGEIIPKLIEEEKKGFEEVTLEDIKRSINNGRNEKVRRT